MKKILVFLLFPFLFSCSTDFDTIAEYEEIIVVYGFLNQYDSVQLIRVNKAFLGEGNALIMAQVKDSINVADTLDVSLDRIVNGVVTATYPLQHFTGIPKDSGLFNYPYQVFYKLSGTVHMLDVNSQYRLRITHDATGLEVSSATAVLGNCDIVEPDPADRFNFVGPVYPSVILDPAARAKIYNMTLRFHYSETVNGTTDTLAKYFDWFFFDKVVDPESVTEVRYPIPSPDFYFNMGEKIPVDTHVTRKVGHSAVAGGLPIEIRVTAGSEELYLYMQLTEPSNSVVQERPQFSNIVNGTGLFTGRLAFSAFRGMTPNSVAAIDTSQYTENLGF